MLLRLDDESVSMHVYMFVHLNVIMRYNWLAITVYIIVLVNSLKHFSVSLSVTSKLQENLTHTARHSVFNPHYLVIRVHALLWKYKTSKHAKTECNFNVKLSCIDHKHICLCQMYPYKSKLHSWLCD